MKKVIVLALAMLAGRFVFAQCDTVNLALGKPASATSLENPVEPASLAFDGDTTSRWSSESSDPQTIAVDLGAVYNLCKVTLFWEAALGKDFTIEVSNDSVSWTPVQSITGNTALKDTISFASTAGRYVRMVGTARGTPFGYSLYEFQVFGAPSGCNSINLALGQPVVVSSSQPGLTPADAVDGDMITRWGSDASDPQFIYVDLGSSRNICQVSIYWEAAYATSYTIDVSDNETTWTTITTVPSNAAKTNILNVSGTGRYLRVTGLTRATPFGYSIFELQVRDLGIPLPIKLVDFSVSPEGLYSLLEWTTELETNNQYFNIERSGDGSSYTTIGKMTGAGNSNTPRPYEWTDSLPLKGINYYRLKQVDLDGKSSYSKVVTVLTGGGPGTGVSVFPNPVRDVLNVVIPAGLEVREIAIYNSTGSEIKHYKGLSNPRVLQLPFGGLPGGVYTMKIISNKGTELIKLLK